ncbi:MAG TPA: DUF222 domain-containing protein, partial [Acidimicrobiales bacterium]|nr:DUF222 domain-containing protein [Acidimicrobiales bacterium]
DFDAGEAWRADGATSTTAWLGHQTRQSRRDASWCARTARRLRDLPVTAAAYLDGSLSTGQVQAIVANLNDEIASLFAEAEGEMVPVLVPLSVPDVATAMQAWAQAAKDSLQDDEPDLSEPPARTLFLSETLNGRGELSGGLDPEARELTDIALRVAESPDVEGEPARSPAQRRADAFVDIMRFFLDHQTAQPGGRHRHHMNVIVRYEDLINGRGGEFADGTRVDGATIQRLACDAGYHRVVTQGRSSILDYGTTRRNIPVNLFNALVVRDRGCRFPGCDRPPHWCEAHHIDHWEHHGPTSIGNLVLACSRHHHLLHMPGWHIHLRPDATLDVTTPTGQTLVDQPPGHTAELFVDAT